MTIEKPPKGITFVEEETPLSSEEKQKLKEAVEKDIERGGYPGNNIDAITSSMTSSTKK